MTNAEKFVEVFGTDLKRQYATKSWWDQEFVPVKTGHWIKLFLIDTSDIDGQCSECGFIHKFIDGHAAQYNYCPNCGAKMQEVEE